MRYIAFLRGINVGGHTIVKMSDLVTLFKSVGFTDVKTVLNSGNVIFSYSQTDVALVRQKIEDVLHKKYNRQITVLLSTNTDLDSLTKANPFKNVHVTPQTRLYVTFLPGKPKSRLTIPYVSPEKDFHIVGVINNVVCSLLIISPKRGTTEVMGILEKEYGKEITTRNWNTIARILKKADE